LAIIFAGRVIALGSPRELKLALTGRETASLEEVFVAAVESGRRT
jgi:hypothetical protein